MESDPRAILATRVFDAPRELVFAVWSDPAHLANWWGPNGFTTTTSSFDVRAGGVWRFVMHGPDGRGFQNRITYEEVVSPLRIVYRHGGGGDIPSRTKPVASPRHPMSPTWPLELLTTVTFEDAPPGKT